MASSLGKSKRGRRKKANNAGGCTDRRVVRSSSSSLKVNYIIQRYFQDALYVNPHFDTFTYHTEWHPTGLFVWRVPVIIMRLGPIVIRSPPYRIRLGDEYESGEFYFEIVIRQKTIDLNTCSYRAYPNIQFNPVGDVRMRDGFYYTFNLIPPRNWPFLSTEIYVGPFPWLGIGRTPFRMGMFYFQQPMAIVRGLEGGIAYERLDRYCDAAPNNDIFSVTVFGLNLNRSKVIASGYTLPGPQPQHQHHHRRRCLNG